MKVFSMGILFSVILSIISTIICLHFGVDEGWRMLSSVVMGLVGMGITLHKEQ